MLRDGATAFFQGFILPQPGALWEVFGVGGLTFILCFSVLLYASKTRARTQDPLAASPDGQNHIHSGIVIEFAGKTCTAISPAAQDFLNVSDPRESVWQILTHKFQSDGLETALRRLEDTGHSFEQVHAGEGGRYFEIAGAPVAGLVQVKISDVTQSHLAKQASDKALVLAQNDLKTLTTVLDEIPALAWINSEDGTLIWSNNAYANATMPVENEGDFAQSPFVKEDLERLSAGKTQRIAAQNEMGQKSWYTLSKKYLDGGALLYIANDATKAVEAEQTLHRFICTLTETFAHIPIGLSVFDADRSLSMFNPALSEQLNIDPTWLAARPDLTTFLERLREQRKMPEARDFIAWREKVSAIEKASISGTFSEDWDLPGGQTLRVTGRPHPQGAVALLFEDVSSAKTLERKYSTEIELSQTILDTLSEAVAVFDTAGKLVFSNRSFETVWGFEPSALGNQPTIREIRDAMETRCATPQLFEKVYDFVAGTGTRANWRAQFETQDGKMLMGQFVPLPDGSSLIAFLDVTKGGSTFGEVLSAYKELELDRENERDLMHLSLTHLRSILSAQERLEGEDIRGALSEKLVLLENLLATSVPDSGGFEDATDINDTPSLPKPVVKKLASRAHIEIRDHAGILDAFETAALAPSFLNSVIALARALGARGGHSTVELLDDALRPPRLTIHYTAQEPEDLLDRRTTLVMTLMRELANKYDINLTFEPGENQNSIRGFFALPNRRMSSKLGNARRA